jgi:phage-related protein
MQITKRTQSHFRTPAEARGTGRATRAGEHPRSRARVPRTDHCGGGPPRTGVFEIALSFKGDAFRVVYAVHLADEIWVVHAFRKKSTQGIKTPQREIDPIKDRLKRLKEMLR